jgi:hypothetical protein
MKRKKRKQERGKERMPQSINCTAGLSVIENSRNSAVLISRNISATSRRAIVKNRTADPEHPNIYGERGLVD